MTKSTPISNLQQSNPPPPPPPPSPPLIQHPPSETQDLTIESALKEFDSTPSDNTTQKQLQDQIDLLKMQLNTNKEIIPNQPSPPITITDNSLINKNTLLYLTNNFDYKLFIIVFLFCIIIYSSSIRDFLFNKLDAKKVSYIHPYLLAFLVALCSVICHNI
jgi:hypothetical protein